ncbi:MAG: KTSC domain-containing protein [Lysobacter sp.]|nr:KTSC domain-containing protein [Lysobacter sp.]
MPNMQNVDSSSIEAIGYEAGRRELHVRFRKTGETYIYYAVGERVYAEMMQSESKGRYLNANIKPNYRVRKP